MHDEWWNTTGTRLGDFRVAIALTRAEKSVVEVWQLKLQDALPVVPVPLKDPDPDVALDLATALTTVYDEAFYNLSIDYSQEPPPPTLSDSDQDWIEALVRA